MPEPIQCVYYETVEEAREAGGGQIQPGAMWPAPWLFDLVNYLSPKYYEKNIGRSPLVVKLPDGSEFCVDSRATRPPSEGWDVTGEPPRITVSPSILIGLRDKEKWHGFLRDGVLTSV